MILLDTSFLIALIRKRDEKHTEAEKILGQIKERTVITDHVLSELITFMVYKDGKKTAYEVGKKIMDSDVIIVSVLREDLSAALGYVGKYEGFSMCDALSIVVMQKLGIKKIVSFDSDFDRIRNIERIS